MILSHSSRFVLKFIVSRFIAAKVNLKIVPSSSLSLLPAFPSSRSHVTRTNCPAALSYANAAKEQTSPPGNILANIKRGN